MNRDSAAVGREGTFGSRSSPEAGISHVIRVLANDGCVKFHFNQCAHALRLTVVALVCCVSTNGFTQSVEIRGGDPVPRHVRDMYDRGLQFLVATQDNDGTWPSNHQGSGVTGLGLLCFLAAGDDPNFGVYSTQVRRALRSIINSQHEVTGYMGPSMYHHGFAMLALAESYGMVDQRSLWVGAEDSPRRPTIGQALELAVRCAVTSQQENPHGAWRYRPGSRDADTSVAGAVLMGMLAARNAGIEVSDQSIDSAIDYFVQMTAPSGQVAYSQSSGGHNDSVARVSIASLVFAAARRKDLKQYAYTLDYLRNRAESGQPGHGGIEYQYYYQAQALFQADAEMWRNWNDRLVRELKSAQATDGSFDGAHGRYVATTLSLLALAVNYRFLPIYER